MSINSTPSSCSKRHTPKDNQSVFLVVNGMRIYIHAWINTTWLNSVRSVLLMSTVSNRWTICMFSCLHLFNRLKHTKPGFGVAKEEEKKPGAWTSGILTGDGKVAFNHLLSRLTQSSYIETEIMLASKLNWVMGERRKWAAGDGEIKVNCCFALTKVQVCFKVLV